MIINSAGKRKTGAHDDDARPKRSRRELLYLNTFYGDPAAPKESEVRSTLNYCRSREEDRFYLHPLSAGIAAPGGEPVPQPDASRIEAWTHPPELRSDGPCLHCGTERFPHGRVFLAKDRDRITGAYVVWGNFCDFPCALRYALEHQEHDTPHALVTTQRMAAEVWGRKVPIRAAPPRLCLARFRGHVSDEDVGRAAETENAVIREARFVSYAMMVECQRADDVRGQKGQSAGTREADEERRARAWNIRGLRAPLPRPLQPRGTLPFLSSHVVTAPLPVSGSSSSSSPSPPPSSPAPSAAAPDAAVSGTGPCAAPPSFVPTAGSPGTTAEADTCLFDEFMRARGIVPGSAPPPGSVARTTSGRAGSGRRQRRAAAPAATPASVAAATGPPGGDGVSENAAAQRASGDPSAPDSAAGPIAAAAPGPATGSAVAVAARPPSSAGSLLAFMKASRRRTPTAPGS